MMADGIELRPDGEDGVAESVGRLLNAACFAALDWYDDGGIDFKEPSSDVFDMSLTLERSVSSGLGYREGSP